MGATAALLDLLFPPRCAACRELLDAHEAPVPAMTLCVPCGGTLEPLTEGCGRCAVSGATGTCADCSAHVPSFDRVQALWVYGGAIARVLHRYKYEDEPSLAEPLGRRLAALELRAPDVVAPVPLHGSRSRARTFDQAFWLAKVLARERGWRLDPDLLERTRATQRQVGRQRDERWENVARAFAVRADVRGLSVLLVDDVVTTGATVEECARVLKVAGAARVEVVAVARA